MEQRHIRPCIINLVYTALFLTELLPSIALLRFRLRSKGMNKLLITQIFQGLSHPAI